MRMRSTCDRAGGDDLHEPFEQSGDSNGRTGVSPRGVGDGPEALLLAAAQLSLATATWRDVADQLKAVMAWLANCTPAQADCFEPTELAGDAEGLNEEDLNAARRCDVVFQIIRRRKLSDADRLGRNARLCYSIVRDLVDAPIHIDDVIAILNGMAIMLVGLRPALHPVLQQAPSDLVVFRWIRGHQFLFAAAAECVELLRGATAATEARCPVEGTATALQRAAELIRAMASGLSYTSLFPAVDYTRLIRPALAQSAVGRPLSGSDHFDFRALRSADDRLKTVLYRSHGTAAADWPAELLAAFRSYHRAELTFCESHIKVADAKVASAPSILQEAYASGLSAGSATDVLRDLAALKRAEYRLA